MVRDFFLKLLPEVPSASGFLRFPDPLEAEFTDTLYQKFLPFAKLLYPFAIFVHIPFFICDIYIVPDIIPLALGIRLSHSAYAFAVFLSFKTLFFRRNWRFIATTVPAGFALLIAIKMAVSDSPGRSFYILGLLVTMVPTMATFGFGFAYALGTGIFIILNYLALVVFFPIPGPDGLVAFTICILVFIFVICLMANLILELHMRRDFILSRELAQKKEEAENATRLKDGFVSLVSHDLRAPLATIVSTFEMLGEHPAATNSAEVRARLIGTASKTADHMVELIDNLLDINKLKTGQITPVKVFTNLNHLVSATVQNLHSQIQNKGTTVINDIPHDAHVYADPVLFGRVVQNLLSNAVKFSPPGGAVTVFTTNHGSTVAVMDSGAGVPGEFAPHLFHREVETVLPGTTGERGAGIGLPYSYDIMKAHGGEITFETSPEKGTIFYAHLPAVRHVVYLIDSDVKSRRDVRKILPVDEDFAFVEMHDTEEAFAHMAAVKPHLIILALDHMNAHGYRFLAQIRQRYDARALPVIAVTSDAGCTLSSAGYEGRTLADLGVREVLPNDTPPSVLLYTVRKALGSEAAAREAR